MKMRAYFHSALIFLLLLTSSSFSAAAVFKPVPGDMKNNTPLFFELNNADKKEFIVFAKFKTSRIQEVIKDTLLANGLTYKQIRWKDPSNSAAGVPFFEYQRIDTSGNIFIFLDGKDKLLYDFSKKTGDIYASPFTDYSWKVLQKYNVTIFGKTFAAVDLELLYKDSSYGTKETVAEKMGLLNFQGESPHYPGLRSAEFWGGIINKEKIGDLLAIDNKFAWESFYPLDAGDVWRYDTDGTQFYNEAIIRQVLKDTVLSDGYVYKKILNKCYLQSYSQNFGFERMDSSGTVYSYETYSGKVCKLFEFSSSIGDTFSNCHGIRFRVSDKSYIYNDLTGKYVHFLKLNSINTLAVFDPTFMQDIGITYIQLEFAYQSLRGALIKGVPYGDTNRVTLVLPESRQVSGFSLGRNYPNPFNPSTAINYSIPFPAEVSIKVYDVLGNEIRTLVNETKNAGKYRVKFDGSMLPSGVYFYRLKAGTFKQSGRMLLIK